MDHLAHTYSIIARDPKTGQLGIGVQSHAFACGAIVPWAEAGIGAIAGIIITPIIQMDYGRGPLIALKGFGAAVLGGLGNSLGDVVAGFLLGIMEAMGGGYISTHYMDAIALIVLLLVLFARPSGIFGSAEAARFKDF